MFRRRMISRAHRHISLHTCHASQAHLTLRKPGNREQDTPGAGTDILGLCASHTWRSFPDAANADGTPSENQTPRRHASPLQASNSLHHLCTTKNFWILLLGSGTVRLKADDLDPLGHHIPDKPG